MLLPEVLDFATRLDHILTQLGGSVLLVGPVEPEEEHFCSWLLIPTILPYVVIPKITQNYAVKNFITDLKVVCCVCKCTVVSARHSIYIEKHKLSLDISWNQLATVIVVSTGRLGDQCPIEYQLVITSPGGHPNKDGRTRDSSSALMRVHQSSFPMDDRMTNTTTVCIHHQWSTLVISIEANKGREGPTVNKIGV